MSASCSLPTPPHASPNRTNPPHPPPRERVERMYLDLRPFVSAVARRAGASSDETDDVVQEVFLRVLKGSSAFRGQSHLKTWLYAITRNVVVDSHRRRSRESRELCEESFDFLARCSLSAYSVRPEGACPEKQVQRQSRARAVHSLLRTLAPEQRQVLVAMAVLEMTGRETAEAYSLNLNTVHSRLRLARDCFRSARSAAPQLGEIEGWESS